MKRESTHRLGLAVLALVYTSILLALPSGLAAQDSAPIKIAVVQLEYLVGQSPSGQALQARLEAFSNEARAEIEAKSEEAKVLARRITEGANALSEEKLAELQKEYEDLQIAVRRIQDDKQRQGQKIQMDGLRGIEQQLEPVFSAIREEEGYDLILNNVPGTVIMSSDRVDITEKVLERLRQ